MRLGYGSRTGCAEEVGKWEDGLGEGGREGRGKGFVTIRKRGRSSRMKKGEMEEDG